MGVSRKYRQTNRKLSSKKENEYTGYKVSVNQVSEDKGINLSLYQVLLDDEFIGVLFVSTDYQGSGIGKELINYVIDKYNKLNLAVYKDNKKSVEFYPIEGLK